MSGSRFKSGKGPRVKVSVRRLSLVVLVVAVVLAYFVNRANSRRDAIAALRAAGGQVSDLPAGVSPGVVPVVRSRARAGLTAGWKGWSPRPCRPTSRARPGSVTINSPPSKPSAG